MKVLIIKLGALGDIIMSTPVIKRIQEFHSGDELYLLTTPGFLDFFSGWNNLSLKSFERSGLSNTVKQLLWIRKNSFDRIYDLQSNDRTALLCAFSGSSYRAGNHPHYPYNIHPNEAYHGQCHSFDRLNEILASANIDKAPKKPFLYSTEKTRETIDAWLEKKELKNKNYILIHAGSSARHKNKRWPYFDKLAETLAKHHFTVIWIGAAEDSDLNKSLSKKTGIDATGLFSIIELVEVGKHAKFAITNDSAPMHMLSCSDIPVYGLFGPTNPRRTHALGQEDRVIFAGDKLPENDMAFKPSDIANISVETVLNRLKSDNLLI